jgi:polyphosphate kinase 2 (PPK2 family)
VGTEVLSKSGYGKELRRLQVELGRLQEWIVQEGLKVVVLFEGRDTAGKGGVIRRIAERTNPRVVRTVALGVPSDRERASGTSSATWRTCRRRGRWSSSIAAGTTAPGSSG